MIEMKTAVSLVLAFLLAGVGCGTKGVGVTQYGKMREVLRDGRTEPRIDLVEATRLPHALGVGALENLDGEITIVDGEVWVARAFGDDVSVSGPAVVASDRATLLTLSHVLQWQRVELTRPLGGTDLEIAVEELARAQGIDTNKPFPFVIDGEITELDLHVIAGSCPLSGKAGGVDPWRLSIDRPVQAKLIAFFANDQAGIMTHHGSRVHMHIVMRRDGRTITAHVDQVMVAAGSVLRLPM